MSSKETKLRRKMRKISAEWSRFQRKRLLRRADALHAAGQPEAALAVFDRAVARAPGDTALLNARAKLGATMAQKSTLTHVKRADHIDIPTVCQCFWDVERDLSLADFKICGMYYWPIVRMKYFYRITQQLGLYDAPHPTKQKRDPNMSHDARTHAALEKCAPDYSATSETEPFDKQYAVLIGTRKIKNEEPYTLALRQETKGRAIILDIMHNGVLVPDAINVDALYDLFRKTGDAGDFLFEAEIFEKLADIQMYFDRRLGVNIGDLGTEAQSDLRVFSRVRDGFARFWKACPVQTLFITDGYSLKVRAAAAAAQSAGIRIIELQHGFISRFHLGYSWPERNPVPYMPDELWCFGDFWPDSTPLPANTKPRTIGAPFVTDMAKLSSTRREAGLITVTSQAVVGRQLFEASVRLAQAHPQKGVIFRLHPSEDVEGYEKLLSEVESPPSNLSISHKDPVIFEVLAKTDILVGAFSTTLLEGMALGCRTIVLKLPGIEYMEPIIERGDSLMVRDTDELIARIDEAPHAQDPAYYYATPVTPLT